MTAVESERIITTESPAIDPRDMVAALRASVLELKPVDIALDLLTTATSVWGIVIETGYPDAVASLIALADGSVSLYVSNGSGSVGCGANLEVRSAGAELLAVAERGFPLATCTDDTSYPPPGSIRFCFLSRDGLRSLQVKIEELHSTDVQLSALYFAGQRVINAIERSGAGQSIEQEIRIAQAKMANLPERTTREATTVGGSQSCLSVGNAVHRLRR